MTKPHIFSDFDGTITETDTLVFLATRLGGGARMVEAIGRLIGEGKLSLRDGIAAEMRSIRKPFAEAERLLREEVRIDSGFAPLARWSGEKKIPLTIVSAGFHQIIDLFISRDEIPDLEILANHISPNVEIGWQCRFRDGTDWGHDKSSHLKEAQAVGEYVIFIGDGLSDQAAAEAADEVFAKHALAEYCRERRINCHEYQTFDEIMRRLQERF
ncbi:MAG TPA: HAD-IB family phosphatase [Blastocatellia bacterium]|nr:HAD-IB family phosphatase [Blastocatellia bacterium]